MNILISERKNLKANVGRNKMIMCGKTKRRELLNLILNEEILEVVDSCYHGSVIGKNGDVVEDAISRVT